MTANTTELRDHFQREGFAIGRRLFSLEETTGYRDHYMRLSEEGPHPNHLVNPWDDGEHDPLKRYPRLFNMHRWDEISQQWLLHERLRRPLEHLAVARAAAASTGPASSREYSSHPILQTE